VHAHADNDGELVMVKTTNNRNDEQKKIRAHRLQIKIYRQQLVLYKSHVQHIIATRSRNIDWLGFNGTFSTNRLLSYLWQVCRS